MRSKSIGIDLGTTNSCVAVCDNENEIHICQNDSGSKTTPSYVCFTENDRLIGVAAKLQSIKSFNSTIFDVKRLIGRNFGDEEIRNDKKYWPFDIIEENSRLKIQITVNGVKKSFFPEEISGMILSKMKEYANDYLGSKIKIDGAVITVPAYFNDAQRQATKIAGSFAELKVLRMVNEPTAAAFAFQMVKNDSIERHILVYDFGGGTFDVSVLKTYNTKIRVLATMGDNYLGGDDFDNKLLEYCLKQFKRHNNIEIEKENSSESKKAIRRLKNACENAKITLSAAIDTNINLDALYNGKDFRMTLSRARFEGLIYDLIAKTMEIVDKCIAAANLTIDVADLELVLVGGSTRLPKIRDMLGKKFPKNKINKNINPDEAVAQGAAIFANILSRNQERAINDDDLVDVTPLSLGVESKDGVMSVIIERNTEIPTEKTKTYSTVMDDQSTILIKVYEGERSHVEDNNLLGEFEIMDIPPGKKGIIKFDVTFKIDANSILIVSAVERSTQIKQVITISNEKSRLRQEEINRIVEEGKMYKAKDEERREAVETKNKLIKYLENMKIQLRSKNFNVENDLSDIQINELCNKYDEIIEWAEFSDYPTKDKYVEKRDECENEYRELCGVK